MADPAPTDSPGKAAAGVADGAPTEAFSPGATEIGLAIRQVPGEADEQLSQDSREPKGGNVDSFSGLLGRVGVSVPGESDAQPERLAWPFLELTPDGYLRLPAGRKCVETVIGGAGVGWRRPEQPGVGRACRHCSTPTSITSQHQRLYRVSSARAGHIASDAAGLTTPFDELALTGQDCTSTRDTGLGRTEVAGA